MLTSCFLLRSDLPTAEATAPAPAEVWASEAGASVAVHADEGECTVLPTAMMDDHARARQHVMSASH